MASVNTSDNYTMQNLRKIKSPLNSAIFNFLMEPLNQLPFFKNTIIEISTLQRTRLALTTLAFNNFAFSDTLLSIYTLTPGTSVFDASPYNALIKRPRAKRL